jgi:anti-sigma factor RsiW
MTTPHLSDDDVRDLFSDHLEGALDDATRRAVDEALDKSPALAAEHRAFAATLEALRALPRVEAPERLVGQVRDRLTAERRAEQGAAAGPPALPLGRAANDDSVAARWSPLRLMSGLAAVAAVVAIVAVAVPDTGGGPTDMLGAGLVEEAVTVQWRAPGLSPEVISTAAATAGMGREGSRFVGDRAATARFFIELKVRAIAAGSDVSGAVPEQAEQIVVTVGD